MQWYEKGGYYAERFLRELTFIEEYNVGKKPEDKLHCLIDAKTKIFCVCYRTFYEGKPYYVQCEYPTLYPKVRIKVIIFNQDFKPHEIGYHIENGVLCMLLHYPNQWDEDFGIEFVMRRVKEWFEDGQYNPDNILPDRFNLDNSLYIFGEPLLEVKDEGVGLFRFLTFNDKASYVTSISINGSELTPNVVPESYKHNNVKEGQGIVIFSHRLMPEKIGVKTYEKIKPFFNSFRHGKKGFMKFAEAKGIATPIPLVIWDLKNNQGNAFLVGEKDIQVGRIRNFKVYEDIFKRIKERDDLESLKSKKIGIVGLGALGSTIATELARSGISDFILVDNDKLALENIGRHDLTLKDIDKYKVLAITEKIKDINPLAKCFPIPFNVLDDYSLSLKFLSGCDLVVSTIDDPDAKFALDSVLIPEGKKVVYSGVFYNAVSGFVLVSEKRIACFKCLSLRIDSMVDSLQIPDFGALLPEDVDYRCGLPTFPGGSINTHSVALLAARVTIDILLKKREMANGYPFNFYLLGNEKTTLQDKPFFNGYMDLKRYTLPGIENCEICDRPKALTEEEENYIQKKLEKIKR